MTLPDAAPAAGVPADAPLTITPESVVAATPGTMQVPVGEGRLLFDPSRVRAHALNRTAAAIWDLLAEASTRSVATVTAQLVAATGADPGTVGPAVADVLAHLAREGAVTVDGAEAANLRDSPPGHFANVPHTDEPAPPELRTIDWAVRSPTYRGIEVPFRFSCSDAGLGSYLADVLAPLRDPEPPEDGIVREYLIVGTHPDAAIAGLVVLDDHVVTRARGSNLAASVLWHVNQLVSTEAHGHWLLHASAACPPAATERTTSPALVFPASMNAGKSTLVAGLVRAGYRYITDETVAVDPATLEITPYPKAIALDPGSWPVLPELEPVIRADQVPHVHRKWYADPQALGFAPPVQGRVPLGAVVFPRYQPEHETSLDPLDPLAAAVALAENSFNLVTLGQRGLDAVAALATGRPCFRLRVRDLPSAVAAIESIRVPLAP